MCLVFLTNLLQTSSTKPQINIMSILTPNNYYDSTNIKLSLYNINRWKLYRNIDKITLILLSENVNIYLIFYKINLRFQNTLLLSNSWIVNTGSAQYICRRFFICCQTKNVQSQTFLSESIKRFLFELLQERRKIVNLWFFQNVWRGKVLNEGGGVIIKSSPLFFIVKLLFCV